MPVRAIGLSVTPVLVVTATLSALAGPALPVTLVSKVDPVTLGATESITIKTAPAATCEALLTAASAYAHPIRWHQVTADPRGLATWVEPVNRLVGSRTLAVTCTAQGVTGRLVVTYAVGVPQGAASGGSSFCQTNPTIVPAGGIGQITLGMPAQGARTLLDAGGVAPQIRGGRPPALREIRYTSGPNVGVTYLAKDARVQVVSLLYTPSQTSCATPEGIHLGSASAAVAKVYGPPPKTYTLPAPSRAELLIYDVRGIAFAVASLQGATGVVLIQVFTPGTYCQFFAAACR